MRKALLLTCRIFFALALLAALAGCGTPESRARRCHKRGLLYARNNRPKEAVQQFKKALSLNPRSHETRYELGQVYLSQRLLPNAENEFRKAIGIKPDYVDAYLGLAGAMMHGKKVGEAIQVCQGALQKKPDSGRLHGLLGDIHRDQGQTQKAIEEYRVAVEKQPALTDVRVRLARTLFSAGRNDEARQVASAVVEKPHPANYDAYVLLSAIFEKEGQYDKAIEQAKLAVQKDKGRAAAHAALAVLYLRTSQFDLALKEAQQAVRSPATRARGLFARGCVMVQQKKFSDAVIDLQSALREQPDWAEARYQLARALYADGHPQMAATEYETLLQQVPEFDEARLQLAMVSLDQGWFSSAESHCKKILERNPNDKAALRCLLRAYDVQGKIEDAAITRTKLDAVVSGEEKTDLQLALETLAAGNADAAIDKCKKALESKPNDVGFLNVLGSAYLRKREFEEAATSFRKAVEADPSSINSYLNLSAVFLLQRKYDEAAQQCRLALEKDPKAPAPHFRLGTIYRLENKYDDAVREFEAAAEANPADLSVHEAVLDVLMTQKKYKDAVAYCDRLFARFPNTARTYELAGRVYLAQGKADEAIAQFQKAVEEDKSLASARVTLAKVYLSQKKNSEARKELQQALRLVRDTAAEAAFVELAPLYEVMGEPEPAIADVQAVLDENKNNIAARLIRALLRCISGQLEQAAQEAREVAAGKDFAPSHYILGWVRAKEGNRSESIVELRNALTIRPDWVDARMKLSGVLKADGRHQEAIDELEVVLKRLPDYLPALLSVAESEAQIGLLDSAERHCSRAAELEPANTAALILLGNILVWRGDLDEAGKVYARIQEASPTAATAPAFIAAAQLSSRKADEAIATCQKAISSGSKDARLHNILGLAQLSKGMHSEAISSFRESLSLDPQFLVSRVNLAAAYNAAGNADLAAEELATVLARTPKAAWVRARFAELLVSQQKFHDAAKELDLALKDSQNNPIIAAVAGQSYMVMKDYAKAREMFEMVVASAKDKNLLASAYNNLAWASCMEGKDLPQALPLATKAEELRPDDGNILDTIGWILYKLERYKEAGEKLTSAVAKIPDNPSVRYHLGMALLKQGQKEEALKQLKTALSLSSVFDGADVAKQLLAEMEKAN